MYQEQIGDIIIIKPSEGYTLALRGVSSKETYKRISRHKDKSFDDIIEVKKENLPIYIPNYEKNIVEGISLDEVKQHIILQTKKILEEFLSNNPLLFEGEYYNVSSSAQNHLISIIKAAESAEELGISYMPMWNAVGKQRQYYSLETLKKLLIEIQKYVLFFVIQQQKMELEILSIRDKKELLNFSIIYSKED